MIHIQETFIDRTRNALWGETDVYPTGYAENERGKLYRSLVRQYGRCTSKVYIGDNQPVGWVFVKRERYEDTREPYLSETWVTLHSGPDTVTPNYLEA